MKRKTYRGTIQLKADSDKTGAFRAEFATLGVIDHDGDVTRPGAFIPGQGVVIEAWNHNYSELPVGKGAITEEDDKAIVEGYFFLDTVGGMEHYKVVKELGELQEWSYTFDILESSQGKFDQGDGVEAEVRFLDGLDVWGVAPVERGAGIGTRTVVVKMRKDALPAHDTETTEADWDGPANEARAKSGEDVAYYKRIFAWQDPEGDPTVKGSYKFPHHMISEDGTPGAASVKACQSGIGVLNGSMGGSNIPDGDRGGVWAHLAAHLRDADVEPAELKALPSPADQLAAAAGELKTLLLEFAAKFEGLEHAPQDPQSQDEAGGDAGKSRSGTLAERVKIELLEAGVGD